jgi:hypothetical protein
MSNFILEMAAHVEGFTDEQFAQIESSVPDAQALLSLLKKNEAAITEAIALIKKLTPTATMVLTVFKENQT